MKSRFILLCACALALAATGVQAQNQPGKAQTPAPAQAKAPAQAPSPTESEITFVGKLYSPLKLSVVIPYTAQITSMPATIGQRVKKGDTLATFKIPPETRMTEKRALSLVEVKELEEQLAATARDSDKLKVKRQELQVMEKQNMATSQALAQNAEDLGVLEKQRTALQEKLSVEKDLANERLSLYRERFGPSANFGNLPSEGVITAPIDGYVVLINPDLHNGAKLPGGTELFQVGTLDPMLVRAQVHEIETLRLHVNDPATVTFDSMPGKKFPATVSRIPWTPVPSPISQPSYYEIELTLPNPDASLKEGMKAEVTIIPQK